MGNFLGRYLSNTRSKNYRELVRNIIISFCLLFLVSCEQGNLNFISLPTKSPIRVKPTQTALQPTFALPPTQERIPATAVSTPVIETRLYTHPDNLFGLSIPVSWSVSSASNITQFRDPASSISIDVQLMDTQYELELESFTRAVDAREASVFGEFESYLEMDRQLDQDEVSYLIEKRLIQNGVPKTVISLYLPYGPSIIILDLWSGIEDYEGNKSQLSEVLASLSIEEGAGQPSARSHADFFSRQSNGAFSLDIPRYWNHNTSTAENSVVDTFTSPDEQAIIQMVIFDDGEPISGTVAGAFVRNLLRNYYAKDINVSEYQSLTDGREELIWESTGSDYQGITYFDVNDTELIIYTIMTTADFEEIYADLLENVLNSFQYSSN
jgi:hypothetical protein